MRNSPSKVTFHYVGEPGYVETLLLEENRDKTCKVVVRCFQHYVMWNESKAMQDKSIIVFQHYLVNKYGKFAFKRNNVCCLNARKRTYLTCEMCVLTVGIQRVLAGCSNFSCGTTILDLRRAGT